VISKVAGPIYVGGAVDEFVSGRTIRVGEAAGQVKPTTAGGILGSVAGGTMAGMWVAEAVSKNDSRLIRNYQREWEAKFGAEYRLMRRLRRMFESVSNEDIEKMVSVLSSERVTSYLSSKDFDFHASALVSALGVKGALQLAGVLLSVEARQVLSALASS
jgi:flavin-dependent dehydrogenase